MITLQQMKAWLVWKGISFTCVKEDMVALRAYHVRLCKENAKKYNTSCRPNFPRFSKNLQYKCGNGADWCWGKTRWAAMLKFCLWCKGLEQDNGVPL